jgi:hypothetical protein
MAGNLCVFRSERSGETAKSKNYAYNVYAFGRHAINDLERVRITHSGATNSAYLNSVSTYDLLPHLLHENTATQFCMAGVTTKYKILLSIVTSSPLTAFAMFLQVAGEQDMVI